VEHVWYVYVARCKDGSLYTGIAKDVPARVRAHNRGKGAKYTRGRGPLRVLVSSSALDKSAAQSLEAAIKQLPRDAKLRFIRRVRSSRAPFDGDVSIGPKPR
jgi:predicted GIY-YIG superfamily endonuclease